MSVRPLNILLADDDMDDCLFFNEALEEMAVSTQLSAVHDGEQLMQLLNNETQKLPDILFLDINMPRKNGFECLTEIKQNKKLNYFPIVIFSTSFEQEVVNRLYNSGAHFFIRKPSEFALFKKIILHTLTLLMPGYISKPSKENFVISMESSLSI